MEDFLSFLTGNIRKKGMTVNEFCGRVGISRQKFYRFVKEPRRFSDEQLEKISAVLGLKDSEKEDMRSHLHPEMAADPADQPRDYSKHIAALFRRRLTSEFLTNRFEIEYIDRSGAASMLSPRSFARILSGAADPGKGETERICDGEPGRHDFVFTVYNCLSSRNDSAGDHVSSQSMMIIAGILKALEDFFAPSENAAIRVHHYISESKRKLMADHDSTNEEAMVFNFHLFDDILPLLSVFDSYRLNNAGVSRHLWTEQSNLCLVEHKVLAAENSRDGEEPEYGNMPETEYYALAFSEDGVCSACRLGGEEVSHIFRFLSTDTRDKRSAQTKDLIPNNPNLAFYEYGKNLKFALIHPDPCFDDIPKEMWQALYGIVESAEDKAFFESVFRQLMDPYDQYTFLDFPSLVRLAINTLEQRAAVNRRNGKIVVCHPEGLKNLVKTGIITDLQSEDTDYTGMRSSRTPLRFPAPLIKKLLIMIRDSIVRRQSSPIKDPMQYDWVNYYILQPQYPYPDITYIVYRDFGVFPLYSKSRHRHTNATPFQNSAIGTVLYDHIIGDMIGKRGQELDSDVLSDEHSIALIDKLILQLDKEQS